MEQNSPTPQDEDLKRRRQLVLDVFGQELTDAQVAALGPRIDAAARNVSVLDDFEARLHRVERAAVHSLPAPMVTREQS